MPGSDTSDEFNDDVFIVDIDTIQAHGIGVADITKLKTNGYYTVAVCIVRSIIGSLKRASLLTCSVCSRCYPQESVEDKGIQ
ncbi:hypothetical protein BO85DRAFT_146513 [Aspergillus piperis CBS 112811]|uniref:Uncharacterized protein n=1 Tax=Aspergillus piperis CBS 112811 TaxID=1448313 RepID=A0A8G1QUJ8_9EURO|nr:hypothetical protein BO85DRAFT_146513 [Aspergillus piperis CBS 112811]RAH53913.1 hypothetical protein BO85DRAFT_146513 [Aspergillus piperis CBS 112811]